MQSDDCDDPCVSMELVYSSEEEEEINESIEEEEERDEENEDSLEFELFWYFVGSRMTKEEAQTMVNLINRVMFGEKMRNNDVPKRDT